MYAIYAMVIIQVGTQNMQKYANKNACLLFIKCI
jgi:hypothetical protein